MDQEQKLALANYFRNMVGGEQSLISAVNMAAALSPGGKLGTEYFWREIIAAENQPLPTGE